MEGVVQGIGFRPFVKKLADRLQLPGIVFNTGDGLTIEIDSRDPEQVRRFAEALLAEAPVAAHIERCVVEEVSAGICYFDFQILPSIPREGSFTLVSPDLATCSECLAEMNDPLNRRFRYPFTNCTNCGPRYSITLATPYDRGNTTMRNFSLCAECAAEYCDTNSRRFHAEPVACASCGPQLSMDLGAATVRLSAGDILAIKGLGGFQLACNAFSVNAVDNLRIRKRRSRKPFAVMMRDLSTVERYCMVSEADSVLLQQQAAPVVLLQMKDPAIFPTGVAPNLGHLGVMLPYTPLHHLLFADSLTCLVMTSGNASEEPIVTGNEEAHEKLSALADQILTHDRDIFMRVDDSVARTFEGMPRILRRARGYAPRVIRLGREVGEVLATGAELKNTFCITKGRYAIPSQHIGDLENYETLRFFEETLRNLNSVYQTRPKLIAHDMHPDYLSTRWALTRPEPKLAVQHHHAHVASCMAENGVLDPVIGVALDGTGWGTDEQVWGGEFLLSTMDGFERCAHLRYVALPGGDCAARHGWRMAAAHLYDALGPEYRRVNLPCWNAASPASWKIIDRLLERPAIRTSSCGRLFDAVAAIAGVCRESAYEGEAAMLLEAAAIHGVAREPYAMSLNREHYPWTIDTRPMIREIASETIEGQAAGSVARCFHDSVALMIEAVCSEIRRRNGVDQVCLSGGVFQNFTLLAGAARLLRQSGFQVFLHSQVPPNDGGISLGQAVIGAAFLERNNFHVSGDPR